MKVLARPWVSIVVLFPPVHVGRPLGFAPEAALEDLVCPREGQVWRWCSCLGCGGSGSSRSSGELEARAAGNIVLQKGMATSILGWRPPSLTEKPGRSHSTGSQRVRQDQSDPVHIDTRLLPVAALPQ